MQEKKTIFIKVEFNSTMLIEALVNNKDGNSENNRTSFNRILNCLAELINKEESEEQTTFVEKLSVAKSCHAVFLACGTCGDNMAKVEWYCGSGGSAPDYITCESC